ncbi:MAG: hypothetical protein INH41_02440 [Myxococcaceae bacterium]|jgi:hypothetical protein|nr:hypothetical protein [Myxococcaceae bacterium]MCA3011238.1 hypothetical protein [Myxococcaceae bacterium]
MTWGVRAGLPMQNGPTSTRPTRSSGRKVASTERSNDSPKPMSHSWQLP